MPTAVVNTVELSIHYHWMLR